MSVEVTREHGDARVVGESRGDGGSSAPAADASDRPADPPSAGSCPAGSCPAGSRPAGSRPGFVRRYRLPLALGFVALCLYAVSILYILFGRGQIA